MLDRVPERIGRYRVIRVLGRGGMGTIFEAEQDQPRRVVALKLLRSGLHGRETLRRFEYESELLGLLKHPGIAQVYEAGVHTESGAAFPYFAMEYIEGALPITEFARTRSLSARARVELFERVCDAVHHGHTKGVVHRDLKPGNILVDSSGRAKIIDFGVARSLSGAQPGEGQTLAGQLIGTLEYMSPEQAAGVPSDVDTRSDVYSLGVVLHELLTGRAPYDLAKAELGTSLRQIREAPPRRLGESDRTLRGDLETIVLHALQKDRERRYQSALEFSRDLRRYLENQPIEARSPSMAYQLRLFARRNRAAVSAGVGVLAALVLGVIGTTAGLIEARREQSRAEAQRERAESALTQARREAERSAAVNRFMRDLLSQASPARAQGREITVFDAVDLEAQKIESSFSQTPEVEAVIRATVGSLYASLGKYDKAEPHLIRTLELRRSLLGEEHADTISSILELAALYVDMSRYTESEGITARTISVMERQGAVNDAQFIRALNMLGWVQYLQGKNAEAEQVYRRVAELGERVTGKDDPMNIRANAALGMVLAAQGKLDEADRWITQGLCDLKRVLGDRHPYTLYARNIMGWTRSLQKRHDEAIEIHRSLLKDAAEIYTPDHMHLLYWMQALGWRLTEAGRFEEAYAVFLESIEHQTRVLGTAHANTLEAMRGHATAKLRAGQPEEAFEIARRIRDLALEHHGSKSGPFTAVTDLMLGILEALGRVDDAARLREDPLASIP